MGLLKDMGIDPDLERSVLFAHLDEEERGVLRAVISLEHYGDGEIIFHQGTPSRAFYLLLRGGVRMVKVTPGGSQLTLHAVTPGHLFAEAAVFGRVNYPASAVVAGDTTVAAIPRDPFLAIVHERPDLALKLVASLSAWVRDLARMLEERSLKEVGERVAAYLRDERRGTGADAFELRQSKREIAEQLGTTPESFSRALRRLRELGVLVVAGKRITVRDAAALEAAAEGKR